MGTLAGGRGRATLHVLALAAVVALIAGCSTYATESTRIRARADSGDLPGALAEVRDQAGDDPDVLDLLQEGLLAYYVGDYPASVSAFDSAGPEQRTPTCTWAVPAEARSSDGTVASICDALSTLESSGALFQQTRSLGTRRMPATCSRSGPEPVGALSGVRPVMRSAGTRWGAADAAAPTGRPTPTQSTVTMTPDTRRQVLRARTACARAMGGPG